MLRVEDPDLLHALVRALTALKFECPSEEFASYAWSPLVAELANLAYDAEIEAERKRYYAGRAHRLESAREIGPNSDISPIEKYVALGRDDWRAWTNDEKRKHLQTLASPYVFSEHHLTSLIERFDKQE